MKDDFEINSDDNNDQNLHEFDEDEILSDVEAINNDNVIPAFLNKGDKSEDVDHEREFHAYLNMKKKNFKESISKESKLLEKLDEIKLGAGKEVPWVETLSLCTPKPDIDDIHDDLKREASFQAQALTTVFKAHQNFEEFNIPYKRPIDYFAEMLKTDEHMSKIRKKLLEEQKGVEDGESRRKQRELKKFGKQVQTQKVLERQKKKKREF